MLEVSVVHVLPQIWWQGIPYMRTGSRETWNFCRTGVMCLHHWVTVLR